MKTKIIALAIVAVAAVSGAQAQDRTSTTNSATAQRSQASEAAMAKAEQKTQQKVQELGLDERQAGTVKELDKFYYGTLEQIETSVTDATARQEKIAQLDQQYDNRMQHILSPEQFEQMKAMER